MKNVDLQAAAEEIGRLSKQGFLDEGGPVIRLEGIDDEPGATAVDGASIDPANSPQPTGETPSGESSTSAGNGVD